MLGPRQRRRSEKSNFVQTCNLLSRYMKEKGSLRDLNLEIGGKVESLEAIVKPGSTHCASASTTLNVLSDKGKSLEQSNEEYPYMEIDSSINTLEDLTSKEAAAMNSQLTIFYSGKVLVFDDCPPDKAKQLIAFAEKQNSHMSHAILSNTLPISGPTVTSGRNHKAVAVEKINSGGVTPQPQAKESADLPIARRSSLHRFLDKRKHRAAVRGPYHDRVEEQEQEQAASSSKYDQQLELRL